ncbi:MAG: CCA tRNA nucleotidyltransferase [Bdellovibrionales bacterium]|nr:CCA tRNA nucleotidyltransferase [Bdellovibrionales bacterium]
MRLREADWYHLIPPEVKEVLRVLGEAGHTAYVVGGAVRDLLLGSTPKDFDLATSARPEEVGKLFPKTLAVGAQFGIMVVVIGETSVEVATFRKDGLYVDGRHPENVEYSSPREDAERRDFTINGLFWCPVKRQVIDFVGGLEDLERRWIRAIGVAEDRFQEDALRMMRLFRFLAQLPGFRACDATLAAVRARKSGITRVSPERVTQELRRLLGAPDPLTGLAPLAESGLWREWFGKGAIVSTPAWAGEGAPPFTAWVASLLPEVPEKSRLLLSREESQSLRGLPALVGSLRASLGEPPHRKKPLLAHRDFFLAHSRLSAADPTAAQRLLDERAGFVAAGTLDPPPLAQGSDLLALGIPAGPALGKILAAIREAQLDEKIASRAEALALAEKLARYQ